MEDDGGLFCHFHELVHWFRMEACGEAPHPQGMSCCACCPDDASLANTPTGYRSMKMGGPARGVCVCGRVGGEGSAVSLSELVTGGVCASAGPRTVRHGGAGDLKICPASL